MAYQTFTHQIWWVMACYDLANQIRCAKHTFRGRCDITPIVCCSFGGHSTPQFLQCMLKFHEEKKLDKAMEKWDSRSKRGTIPCKQGQLTHVISPSLQIEGYVKCLASAFTLGTLRFVMTIALLS